MMSNIELAKRLTNTLKSTFSLTLFNPWRDPCADCEPSNGPDAKLARLAAHLACDPKFILCGEAPSHRGCRHSGIAFTTFFLFEPPAEGGFPRSWDAGDEEVHVVSLAFLAEARNVAA